MFQGVQRSRQAVSVQPSRASSTNRIEHLDGLRGIAVSMVVLFHTALLWSVRHPEVKGSLVFRYGSMGVELFFLISGFVILMTLERCRTFGEFMGRRWLRLWPAMLIACCIYFPLVPLIHPDPHASILPGLTLIDDRWYSWALGRPVHPLEGAYWSLYLEMRFYVLFAFCYFCLGERSAINILIAMGVVYLTLLTLGYGMGAARWWDIRLLPWFASGALFYRWTRFRFAADFSLAFAVGSLAAWIYYPSFGPRVFGFALIALFAGGLTFISAQRVLSSSLLSWLGAISYPLYLIHTHMIEAFGPLLGIIFSLAAAHLIAKLLEPKLRAAINPLLSLRSLFARVGSRGQAPLEAP